MAALLGVALSELPVVIANTQNVIQSYAQVASSRLSVSPTSALVFVRPVPPTATQLKAEFDLMQTRATVEGAHNLFLTLSTASWTGIHSYIVGTYKTSIYKP